MNKNFRYSETINCIVMLFGPLSKFETRNMMTSKNVNEGIMSTNYDAIVIFPIYGWLHDP